MIRKVAVLLALLVATSVAAEPKKLVVDSDNKPKSLDKYIYNVHGEIPVQGLTPAEIRLAILEGMLTTKGYAWLYEGEGDGYILARFDYRGDTSVMRIEFNQSLIQLKYHSGWGDMACKNNVEDICYRSGRDYYNYVKNLRRSIDRQVKKHLGSK
ncbi:hypothetical protein EDC56_2511 [Sinobacterium caligoides]|uniref:DUF4468 domain-containing protein n=1 Tax=Sinobacterium caligoides TaxID=933926 RepID=A0A3N2DQF0_9GAMM|nr:hypothetical protein [Sinobacterium caligoides]ROS02061.1 hypothetical protein EDC56_2511 [Sinobacterium caligoides]